MVQAVAVTPDPFDIRFLPEGRLCHAAGPLGLDVAAARAGILLEHPCGAQGTCGRCRVCVRSGQAPVSEADRDHLDEGEIEAGWRLGCQLVLEGAAEVEVPRLARSVAGKSFGDSLPAGALAHPVVQRFNVVPRAEDERGQALLDHLAASAGLGQPLAASARALAELAGAWERGEPLALSLEAGEIIASRPRLRPWLGLAVDIGTTSLAAALIDLASGEVWQSGACLNPQVASGSDVIARIRYAMEREAHLAALRDAVRDGLSGLAASLLAEAGCEARDVVAVAVAGNPTMLHAWAGVPVASLGVAPYRGVWTHAASWKAGELGLPVHDNANVFVFPMIRSHVGGDAVAASVACELDRPGPPRLLIDLGTNTELIVVAGDRAVAASAAAGPAFEGVSIRCGMRAGPGAIDLVSLPGDGRVLTSVIGGLPAAGLCGSGVVDAVAELLEAGLLAPSGAMLKAEDLGAAAGAYSGRLRQVDGQQAFLLADPTEGEAAREVLFTARDVREIQLAKGAILTAARLACRRLGLGLADLDSVLIAGAFGNVLRKSSLRRIGLLPGVDPERIRLVGNAAGVGARLAVVDAEARGRAGAFAARAEYVELASDAAYQDTFMEALAFPDRAR